MRYVSGLLVCVLLSACVATSERTSARELELFETIIVQDTMKWRVTMPPECAEPVQVFIRTHKSDPPTWFLRKLDSRCYRFLPGSAYEQDEGVLVHFVETRWLNRNAAEVTTVVFYVGGGFGSWTFRLDLVNGGWTITDGVPGITG